MGHQIHACIKNTRTNFCIMATSYVGVCLALGKDAPQVLHRTAKRHLMSSQLRQMPTVARQSPRAHIDCTYHGESIALALVTPVVWEMPRTSTSTQSISICRFHPPAVETLAGVSRYGVSCVASVTSDAASMLRSYYRSLTPFNAGGNVCGMCGRCCVRTACVVCKTLDAVART